MASLIAYEESSDNSRVYKPIGGTGVIDVLSDMPWTLSPKVSRADAPRMFLSEYQQSTGQLLASIIYFSRVFDRINFSDSLSVTIGKDADPSLAYRDKYFASATGFSYILPYFEPQNISRNTVYSGQDNDNPFKSLAADSFFTKNKIGMGLSNITTNATFVKGVIDASMAGKINFEMPKAWESTGTETYSTTFDLFNTNDFSDIENNRRFCHLISYQNTPSRRNFAIVDPPVIYSMRIPGIVDLPVCYISDLKITNLGNTRIIQGKTIPEAYRIALTFTSLLMPTRNIMLATESGDIVQAINDKEDIDSFINKFLYPALKNGASNGGGFSGGGTTNDDLFDTFGFGGGGFSGGGNDFDN